MNEHTLRTIRLLRSELSGITRLYLQGEIDRDTGYAEAQRINREIALVKAASDSCKGPLA